MAETHQGKRPRDETLIAEELDEPKRRKSYNQILSFLDEEDQDDDDSNQDVSSIFSTLQRELSFDDPVLANSDELTTAPESGSCPGSDLASAAIGKSKSAVVDGEEDEEEEEDRLMKRLLEATDDELGIPNGGPPPVNGGGSGNDEDGNGNGALVMDGGDEFGLLSSFGGLWELEDEAANYYTWFQSELFM